MVHGLITKLDVEFRKAEHTSCKEHNLMFVVDIVVVAAAAAAAAECALLFILVASLCFSPLSQVGTCSTFEEWNSNRRLQYASGNN